MVFQNDLAGPCSFCCNDKLVSDNGEIKGVYAWEFQNTINGHWYDIHDRAIKWIDGRIVRIEIATDITERKNAEREREEFTNKLQKALNEVKTLQGIIPICSYCKKIRDDEGYWKQVEEYVAQHTKARFSHGICPKCMAHHHAEELEELQRRQLQNGPNNHSS